jgi:exopolyphosphatase/pppGpp-phosphohydrolase
LSAALSVVELHLDDVRREHPELVAALGSATVLGLGAVDTIAAIEVGLAGFDPGNGEGDGPLHGFELSRLAVEDVFRTIATEGRADRAHNPGLPPARVDAAVGACAVLVETMRQFGLDQITVSQRGLLDGVAREMIDHGG